MPIDKKDVAKMTNTTVKEVSKVWHSARNDAVKSGSLKRGSPSGGGGKPSSSSSKKKG